jgi:hypothetical protein
MTTRIILALIAAAQLAWPVQAEAGDKDNSSLNASVAADTIDGHHRSRGPHPLPSRSGDAAKPHDGVAADMTNGHHYSGGPHPLPARGGDAQRPRQVRNGPAVDTTNGHHYSSGPHPLPTP